MTNEEIKQVQAYLQGLQAEHSHKLQNEQKARKIAQQESLKMGEALVHIWNYSVENPNMPPAQFMQCVRQMLVYYAPDFDIPF